MEGGVATVKCNGSFGTHEIGRSDQEALGGKLIRLFTDGTGQFRRLASYGFVIGVWAIAFGGCGKYSLPEPPERLSPGIVELKEVTTSASGVSISCLAPTKDVRGKKLNELAGYVLYRKELVKAADAIDPEVPFEVVQRIDDSSLKKLQEKKDEAIRTGTSVRRVSLSGDERKVVMTDSSLTQGHTYLYKVVPYAWEGVDGAHDTLIRVVFTGAGSSVTMIPAADIEGIDDSSVNSQDKGGFADGSL